jgi:uncharacterized protein YukE
VASEGYEVMTGDLNQAASMYRSQGEALREALARFESATGIPASAFGNLPESGDLASEYKQFIARVTEDMTSLSQGLLTGGAKLRVNAAQYQAAEQANTIPPS